MIRSITSQCTGKLPFPTRAETSHYIRIRHPKSPLEPYHCPHCGQWHCGHAPGSLYVAIRGGKPWIKKAPKWERVKGEEE